MKRFVVVAMTLGVVVCMGAGQAWSLSPETMMLLDLLKAKGVISQGEAEEFTKTLEAKATSEAPASDDHHSVQSLADRVERLEGKGDEGIGEAARKIELSGLVEVELSRARSKDDSGNKSNSSDLSLATARLDADAQVNQHVNGHLALLYEEDPSDAGNSNITLDEAVIGFKGGEVCPAYANLGRMYVPFGHFESHFISDPQTLILGETNDTAAVVGYASGLVDINAGVFRGKVKKTGSSEHINSFVASATLSLPKTDAEDVLAMSGGVSYLSNLAASDGLEAETVSSGEIVDTVGGVSAFVSLTYADRYFFDAEYVGAMDKFADGDLSFVNASNCKPQAWNVEAAAKIVDTLEFAIRYGGSNQAGSFLAEDEYGAALLYELFANTALTVEYLFQEFQHGSNSKQAAMQIAIEF